MPKVLHVSEAFGGGIVTSISAFVASTPNIEHHLLYTNRDQDHVEVADDLPLQSSTFLPKNPIQAIMAIRERFEQIQPDWVHLHSSYAGVYGRLAGLPKQRVIYSPHGYAFERKASAPLLRAIYWAIEKLLSSANSKFVGVSTRETKLAVQLNSKQQTYVVPNIYDGKVSDLRARPISSELLNLVTVGRVNAQKDPNFLIASLEQLSPEERSRLNVTWLGGGDASKEAALRQAGVNVTGWAKRSDVVKGLKSADIYIHTAAWEGFPMSIVEAAAMGCPILARRLDAFSALPLTSNSFVDTSEQLASRLRMLIRGDLWEVAAEVSQQIRRLHTVEAQSAALTQLYQLNEVTVC